MALYVLFKNKNTFLFLYFICLLLNLQMSQIILPDPVYEDLAVRIEFKYCFKKRVHSVKNVLKSWRQIKILKKGTLSFGHFSSGNCPTIDFVRGELNMGWWPKEKSWKGQEKHIEKKNYFIGF